MGTSACLIEWNGKSGSKSKVHESLSDEELDRLIAQADAIGIDAPFGWPAPFAENVAHWQYKYWNNELRDQMRFRETDKAVRQRIGKWPLSVSTDLISLPAMRAMALLNRHGIVDKSGGEGGFYEVYPAASLIVWNLLEKGYKRDLDARKRMLNRIHNAFPHLQLSDICAKTDDNLDALVAALSAREAAQGNSVLPKENQIPLAKKEGWIHLPTRMPHPCRERN